MNKELFLNKVNNKETVSTKVLVNNAIEYVAEVVVKDGDSFYQGTIHKAEGHRLDVSGDIKEVVPVEVTSTEYQEVLTLKGTKQELIDKLYDAIRPEIEYLYTDESEPYVGSYKEYAPVSDEYIKEVAKEVVNDIFL